MRPPGTKGLLKRPSQRPHSLGDTIMRHKNSAAIVALLAILAVLSSAGQALADPCGMVPPIYVTDNTSIVRVGDEQTYVFYKDGIETFVIRPGFSGKVEDFGMLISFPTPPALRKVSEDIFPQIAKAIDPPEVVVDLRLRSDVSGRFCSSTGSCETKSASDGLALAKDEVRVLQQEAVGMYEVAVLEAGSAAALKRWMDDHGYKYPAGMDAVCEEYVKLGWCFVAEKAKVGGKANVDPKPRMKGVDTKLPAGSAFDGHVQAMAFRFKTDKLILPMRLSAYNEGEMHNIVYLLDRWPAEDSQHPRGVRRPPAHRRGPVPQRHPAAAAADHRRHRGRHPGLAAPEPAAAARPGAAQRLCQGAVRRRPAGGEERPAVASSSRKTRRCCCGSASTSACAARRSTS